LLEQFSVAWQKKTVCDSFPSVKLCAWGRKPLKPDSSIDYFTMWAVSPPADFSFDSQDLHFTPVKQTEKK